MRRVTAPYPADERTGGSTAPPLSLAARWGGTGQVADLGPDLPSLHYVDFGGPELRDGDGPHTPLVLVHGLGGSHLNWVLLGPQLRRHGRVYALDLAGFGLTRGGERESTVSANVALLAAFLRDPSIPTRRRDADRQVAATFFVYGIPRVGEALVRRIGERSDRQRVMDTTNLCLADPRRPGGARRRRRDPRLPARARTRGAGGLPRSRPLDPPRAQARAEVCRAAARPRGPGAARP